MTEADREGEIKGQSFRANRPYLGGGMAADIEVTPSTTEAKERAEFLERSLGDLGSQYGWSLPEWVDQETEWHWEDPLSRDGVQETPINTGASHTSPYGIGMSFDAVDTAGEPNPNQGPPRRPDTDTDLPPER